MSFVADYGKVEEHEPINPHLWAEMSPPPTRFSRWESDRADATRLALKPRLQMYGSMGRTHRRVQLNHELRFDLQNASTKIAIGNLTHRLESSMRTGEGLSG